MAKKLDKLIDSGDDIFDRYETSLLKGVKQAEEQLFEEVIRILNTVTLTDGKLSTNKKVEEFLLSMDKKILSALKKADWNNSVLRFTKSFDEIGQNVRDLQFGFNNIIISDSQIKPILRIEVQNVIDNLTGSGLTKDLINPLRTQLYRNIYLGSPISEIEKGIREFIVSTPDSESKFLKYVSQISTDAMHQLDGTINSNIQKELELPGIRYIGTIIKDSRAQCKKWVTENSGVIKVKDLKEQIRWAKSGGTYLGKKCSGMNPDTNETNFCVYRGGFRCRHRAIPFYFSE